MSYYILVNKSDYFVGDDSIDREHERLIKAYNLFVYNLKKGHFIIADHLSIELKQHIVLHFINEEAAMHTYGVNDDEYIESHKFEHENFRTLVFSILNSIKCSPNKRLLFFELRDLVFDLITQHILVTDQKLKEFFVRIYKD